ncbi:MAG: 30S ribosomal protein S9 [Zetaproteobacteria bacterium CG06_land_8_20_14_3_00_59_53]|nr:MAG: 30S ribosomal protein S9 [Zetaproteobacteria bacterium CG2_30_59_37]PIO90928.1 MAG: 30S ribosomal protein S9 [Zetaproteobacteria bacterium CG23_combo_of_CG06-09_8_20_14_all_59_86]PIQ64102.1 MAG: 30S ribosomal protein S9 [Zetaproteobacteria bacterium CG11_big_fil_rev_8_21_14_0_20_59_439]PIU71110.1 MAG: 30S ribosomal protein S9 [Zetaproteobacteria bacterium CG06_land_8_20_14_3_00_59_53]PIU96103.1 MAG: 30S ribosomal protein S9 [Zetaproteobacteria bacterium CG03_land_8_20_14_0_80_59_51]PIY
MADTIYRGTGRRKSSTARVIIQPGSGRIVVNGRDVTNYFPVEIVRQHALSPLALTQLAGRLDVRVLVNGGGTSGQAGAIRHGLARALILYDAGLRPQLKKVGMLTRDPREVERKKYGLHKARKAPQFSKR